MSWTCQSKRERPTSGPILSKSVRHLTFMKRKPLPHLIKFLHQLKVHKLFIAGQIITRLFYVIRVSMDEILWYSRPTACESRPWYQWVIPLVWVTRLWVTPGCTYYCCCSLWGTRSGRRNIWASSLCWWRPTTSQADKSKTLSQVKISVRDKHYQSTVLSNGQIFTKNFATNNLLKTAVLFRFYETVFNFCAVKMMAFRYV
jgi:hypothetical protein